jgi:glutamate-1-semialdehyde 2,1-aminomutase
MAAGIAMLTALKDGSAYRQLEKQSSRLMAGIADAATSAGVPVQCTRVGSMVCCFFTSGAVTSAELSLKCDTAAFSRFFAGMLDRGVVLPPSQYETWFLSTAHDDSCIEQTLQAARDSFKDLRKS